MTLHIQPRDREIFRFIYENLYVTAPQIHRAVFKNRNLVTAKVRLGQLYHAKWLEKIKCERTLYKLNQRSLSEVMDIAVESYRYQNRRLRRYQLMHDLQAVDFKIDLKESPLILNFYPQLNLQSYEYPENDYGRKVVMKIPDAVFDLRVGSRILKVALEVENTQKEDRRYKRILGKYHLFIPVDLVFYIVKTPGLKKKLLEIGKEVCDDNDHKKLANKLWVVTFEDFKKDALHAEFESPFGKKIILKGLESRQDAPNPDPKPTPQSEVGSEVGNKTIREN